RSEVIVTTIDGSFEVQSIFNVTQHTELSSLSLHDALPIYDRGRIPTGLCRPAGSRCPYRFRPDPGGRHDPRPGSPLRGQLCPRRSEEHTSELQSRENLVCRLLLEKKYHKETHVHILQKNTV